MWTTVAVAGLLALLPAQSGKLRITNDRFLYGYFGMERPDARFLPGDVAILAYDIENASVAPRTGKVVYDMTMRLTDAKGKLIFEKENRDIEVLNALGSNVQPSNAYVEVGSDQPAGTYVLTISVTDRVSKKKATLKKEFQVLKKEFGFVRVMAPVVSLMGPSFGMDFYLVGFKTNTKKLPDLTVKLTIEDDNGKPTSPAVTMNIPKDLSAAERAQGVQEPLRFPVQFPLNRTGKFTIKVRATDNQARKTVRLDYKITVLDPRKYESGK